MPVPDNAMREKPVVLAREIVARSRLFAVEELQLRFSNGVERTYESLVGKAGYGEVMVVAKVDPEHALLVEEDCAGRDDYQLDQPTGMIEAGDEALEDDNS